MSPRSLLLGASALLLVAAKQVQVLAPEGNARRTVSPGHEGHAVQGVHEGHGDHRGHGGGDKGTMAEGLRVLSMLQKASETKRDIDVMPVSEVVAASLL